MYDIYRHTQDPLNISQDAPGVQPQSTSVLGPRRLGVSRWFADQAGGVHPELARTRAEAFFRRVREGHGCAQARERLDRAVEAYAFAGSPSTSTDLLIDLYSAVNSWRDAIGSLSGPGANGATESGAIPLVLGRESVGAL